jgi:hypothetical protein
MKVIITGATGMVGEGVLLACLEDTNVTQVLIVNRRHYDHQHPKLKELLVPDFLQIEDSKEQIRGYNACFFCAGISSIGMSEEKYTKITFDTTIHFAKIFSEANPDAVFIYVSGQLTDSTEKGRMMWARVKGKTENTLMKMPFRGQYNFRPGAMIPFPNQKNVKPILRALVFLFKVFRPGKALTLHQVARAMINAVLFGYPKHVLEVRDIRNLAEKSA